MLTKREIIISLILLYLRDIFKDETQNQYR